ncbi:MAG TPA: CoA transferase [Xanthobacteraceae bacterium]|nr:CoA transferase [Xanthobacteraceae bacterium]
MTDAATSGPLAGLRILELANVVAGPTACQILADFGAEVIKIEHPSGDGLRRQGHSKDGVPLWWKVVGRNKRSVTLYLGDPECAEIFKTMVATADVVVEGFRPGTLEKWGLGYDVLSAINPGLVLARLSGFGQEGPYSRRPAFGTLIESMTGFAHLTGQPDGPPTLPPLALADYMAGLSAVAAIMMTLYHRDVSNGKGQVIDMTVFEPLMSTMGAQIVRADQLGLRETRTGNRSVNTAPRNVYLTKDGKWIGVASSTNEIAERVMTLVGRGDLVAEPWFKSGRGRVENNDLLDDGVSAWIGSHTRDEVMVAATEAQVTMAPVYDIHELMADPHVQARQMITTVEDDELGPIRMPNVMFRLSDTPGSIRWAGQKLGASNEAVLADEFQVDRTVLDRLRDRGSIA